MLSCHVIRSRSGASKSRSHQLHQQLPVSTSTSAEFQCMSGKCMCCVANGIYVCTPPPKRSHLKSTTKKCGFRYRWHSTASCRRLLLQLSAGLLFRSFSGVPAPVLSSPCTHRIAGWSSLSFLDAKTRCDKHPVWAKFIVRDKVGGPTAAR